MCVCQSWEVGSLGALEPPSCLSETLKNVALTLCLPLSSLPPPGFLHTPDGSHLAPTLSRHSPPVFPAPRAGQRGGSAHPPGAHSHRAGKAATASLKSEPPLTPPLLLTLLLLSFVLDLPLPFLPHLIQGLFSCRASFFQTFSCCHPPTLLIFVRSGSGVPSMH